MTPQAVVRSELVAFLRKELVGPDADDELVDENPRKRYSAGVLFPRIERQTEDITEPPDDEETREGPDGERGVGMESEAGDETIDDTPKEPAGGSVEPSDDNDESVLLANTYFPAAIGMTFLVQLHSTAALVVQVRAAVYESVEEPQPDGKSRRRWKRRALTLPAERFRLDSAEPRRADRTPAEGLGLRLVRRDRPDGTSRVTVSLANRRAPRNPSRPPPAEQCFYQASFSVGSDDGGPVFLPTDLSEASTRDPEEQSLALLYRARRQYAVGHGCAADWGAVIDSRVSELRTEAVPSVVVPPIEATTIGGRALNIPYLAGFDGASEEDIPSALAELTSEYARWLREREAEVGRIPEALRVTAGRHLEACRLALRRMEAGLEVLRTNAFAVRAFMMANRAILMQQYHSKLQNRELADSWPEPPKDYKPGRPDRGRWRSFQIAFLLMNVPAFLDSADGFESTRDIVDLIWFPTGGGKTEAYLGLTAYAIFLRRLLKRDNGGCSALMRYTLRLLTAQQFQRAASLICACEIIRAENEPRLGTERITLGLWVGGDASPNTRKEALEKLADLGKEDSKKRDNPFQLLACPWCGTRLDRPRNLGYVADGGTVVFRCPERRCAFAKPRTLPVTVIDEDIYATPPTLVIGTVDKFAMLAWRPESAAIFGRGARKNNPPDLIIQDELHLISGPLGSMVGLYEAAIEFLCSASGRRPKVVASTATIRRANEQCRALYDRTAFQFPPPALDARDSFFSREDSESDGRTYVGVFATAAPSPVTALVRTAASLHQGVALVPLPEGSSESVRDPYWTQLQYFGSLRELGRAATLVEQDIPEYLRVLRRRLGFDWREIRPSRSPVELTSRLKAEQIPKILEDLKVAYGSPAGKSAKGPINVLLATNMISVGVDVDRLGLMVVVGQPKTTSEYIQASSRVGRSRAAPGLVVTLYNVGKPRDRSHFERFRSYHESFYRFVEPTSVTPFSVPVQERALHALLVTVARHASGAKKPGDLKRNDATLAAFMEYLRSRSQRVDARHAEEVARRLKALMDTWFRLTPSEFGTLSPVSTGQRLIVSASARRLDDDDPAWRTPTSMRNVDVECSAKVLQDDRFAPEGES